MIPIKRKTNQLVDESRRSHTFEYYLKSSETEKLSVCKKMFLGTLGIKDNMVQNWIKNTFQKYNSSYYLMTYIVLYLKGLKYLTKK